ncbi:MAG TPA: S8 family serine peptidase [Bacteriovoracaceae bacterium]|nr:S8 family serine peptidase [Bacteriovoracaceae bacterium]
MKKIISLFFFPLMVSAQTSMDSHRWYLDPHGQELLISIDDLHDETVVASPLMNWGREFVSTIKLKKEVVIAVIDGGIEIEHPELKAHIAYNAAECFEGTVIPPKGGEDKDNNGLKGDCAGWDFVEDHNRPEDQDGHGTHVTGVIKSVMQGAQGNFKFLPLKVFAPDEGRQTVKSVAPLSTRLVKAFEYALARKVDVIHLSVGWPKSFMTYELEQTIKKVLGQGIIVVSAAGNSSQRASIYPCQMDGVICVGALRPDGTVARFSNWGSQVDIFAPGEKILSTIPHTLAPLHISRKGYDYKNGTSQAAPFISATMALMKGVFLDESSDELYSRLMTSANPPVGDKGLKGLFRLDKAFGLNDSSFLFPALKGVSSIVADQEGAFGLKLNFKNYLKPMISGSIVNLNCTDANLLDQSKFLSPLAKGETATLTFEGNISHDKNTINCIVSSGGHFMELKLKVLRSLPAPFKELVGHQDELLVVNTRTGGRSRFITLNTLNGAIPAPFYYITGSKDLVIYHEDKKLGALPMQAGCSFLRVWQIDLDGDQKNELMLESMCDKTHLFYQFLNLDLKEIHPGVKYRPNLTIVNYDDFEVIPQAGLPPVFRFINSGFSIPSESPWESNVSSQANHFYELFPVLEDGGWKFDLRVLESPEMWVKSLGLRYLPGYQVFHHIKGKLLIKLGQKTAWVDVKTQKATWANVDDVLLMGSKKQKLQGSEDFILQSFLTPFEYRGYILNGVKLRYKQEDRFDPVLDILGTQINALGYLTVLRSFQKLLYLQYDLSGNLLSRIESPVDRFDFLTAQDLIASVVNLPFNGEMIQLVDGTKVNTNYVDLIRGQKKTSYEIPNKCVTQQPVIVDGKATLPIFCAKSNTEFEMKFIEL